MELAPVILCGAGDGARTRYLHLGKVALYQMSYARTTVWIIADAGPLVNTSRAIFYRDLAFRKIPGNFSESTCPAGGGRGIMRAV